jgi:hypothetical protein
MFDVQRYIPEFWIPAYAGMMDLNIIRNPGTQNKLLKTLRSLSQPYGIDRYALCRSKGL